MQHCGTISSSRCQTTCIARSKIDATQIQMHGRHWPAFAEASAAQPSRFEGWLAEP
jgi:hypothetical protein